MTTVPPPATAPAALPPLKLIAIGTSAGGVEALGVLLAALPADCPAAVVVVLHIPPDRASLLPSLYAARCPLPIKEVEDKEPVSAGTVYFAAPDYHMQIEPDRTFSLSLDAPVNYSRPSIDVTLESAAYAYGREMLGIILTGASADGAAGLAAVRARGGLAWVQDPAQALASTMPAAALALAGADLVTGLDGIAAGLALCRARPGRGVQGSGNNSGTGGSVRAGSTRPPQNNETKTTP
jgi:two-component system chemotaxis response regulator CheB